MSRPQSVASHNHRMCPYAEVLYAHPPYKQFGDMIKVVVGPDMVEFKVHTGLISHHSSWFRSACEGTGSRDADGTTHTIRLPEDDPEVFEAVLTWVYTRKFSEKLDAFQLKSRFLYKIYIFADKRGVPALKVRVIDALFDKNGSLHYDSIKYVYENTRRGSGLRKFLVHAVMYKHGIRNLVDRRGEDEILAVLPAGFLLEYSLISEALVEDPTWATLEWSDFDRCDYHEHPTNTSSAEDKEVSFADDEADFRRSMSVRERPPLRHDRSSSVL
ncbi:hypothetical protein IWX90DRAFT_435785 [Phyllosticta citrichinensis]|uniref:BTB domain-containing protein n=1 Tax=Phyllosticta citrichinensis TaxID=1130410 RepID=A0ABR1XR22_9PEZI